MKAVVWLFVGLALATTNTAFASGDDHQEGLALLSKMVKASRHFNYSGTFVYQHGSQSQTSEIVHYVNPAGGELEKLETLDGPAREVIRNNDQLTCYLPDAKTVIIEQRDRRQLPVLMPKSMSGIMENYNVRKARKDRVAGHGCDVISLEPKDKLRYGRNFCIETRSGLPLRSRIINEKGKVVESFAFTQLTIGGKFDRDKVKSKFAADSKNWRIDRSALGVTETSANSGWVLSRQLPGFRKLTEMKRSIPGHPGTVSHIVFSDGLSAVSVFIESLPKHPPAQRLAHKGAVNIYTRTRDNHLVTVLGEAPAATVMRIANSLELKTSPTAAR